jgi:hypothetical protein
MFLEVDLYVLRFGLLFFLPEIVKATAAAISASSRERERERKERGRGIGLAALTAMSLPARTSQHVESEDRQRMGEIP